MIVTVTLNPSLDYIVSVKDFHTGMLNRTETEEILPGGKGINVSLVLDHFGIPTKAYGFIAGFTGKAFAAMLEERHIPGDFITVSQGFTRINVKLKSQQETELNGTGPVITDRDLDKLFHMLGCLASDDILVLSGSVPSSLPRTVYADITREAVKQKRRVVVDAEGDLLRNALPFKPFLVKPNREELSSLFGIPIDSMEKIVAYGKELQKQGAKNVLVSLAADGAVLIDETGTVHQVAAPRGVVRNSVGAGDSMIAGFLYGYLTTKDWDKALAYGIATGSASAFAGHLATKEEAGRLLHF